ncbi:MAG: universal stress protein [Rhodobacteraceae bacterium]|nr:universal stress protein [Paracoccaceae bacterium]
MSEPDSLVHGPVLVAVDFSEDASVALVWAARQAELENTSLIVLHVVHDPAASPGFYRKSDEKWLRSMIDVAEEMMESFLAKLKLEHPELAALGSARSRFVSGLPAGRINEVAMETSAHLVVIGSRGRTGLNSILLGSVAERVAQICSVPVVIVKAPSPESSK